MARLPVVPWSMARTWSTSDPLLGPGDDVPEDLLPPEVDGQGVVHLRILDDRLVLESELPEELPAGPLVDQEVRAGDEEKRRDPELSGQPRRPHLLGQDAGQAFQAG